MQGSCAFKLLLKERFVGGAALCVDHPEYVVASKLYRMVGMVRQTFKLKWLLPYRYA